MDDPRAPAPRYLRFATALLLGAAATTAIAATAATTLTACGDDLGDPGPGPSVDAMPPVDMDSVVDGPLPPPDLPRLA